MDASRQIKRKDFYRLSERLLSEVQNKGYTGWIEILLKDRLLSSDKYINEVLSQVLAVINDGRIMGDFQIPVGHLSLNLGNACGKEINLQERYKTLLEKKSSNALAAIFAKAKNKMPVDPVEIMISSEKSDRVLVGIQEKIYDTATRQLDKSKPGLIVCFLESIDEDDLRKLASGSGLQIITSFLLDKPELSHIAAISYCAETFVERSYDSETFSNQGLIFRNSNCKFQNAKDFQFLSGETV